MQFPTILVLIFGLATTVAAQDTWVERTPSAFGNCGHGVTAHGGQLYTFGGYIAFSQASRFDPVANTWTTLASAPGWAPGCSAAADNGICYVFGGQVIPPISPGDRIYAYSIATNTWSTLAAKLTVARGESSAVHRGRSIFIIGGNGGGYKAGTAVDELRVDRVDFRNGTIVPRQDLPEPFSQGAVAMIDGRIYYSAWGNTHEFDPLTDTWAPKAAMPIALDYPGGFALQSRLYVVGGVEYGVATTTHEYFPMTDSWTARASVPNSNMRYYLGGAAINGKGYIHGGEGTDGSDEYAVFDTCVEYTPPSFGAAPTVASAIQRRPGGTSIIGGGLIGGTSIEFAALVTDPEAGQVRLEVEVVPVTEPFEGIASVFGPLSASGTTCTAAFPVLTPGSWKWRYRGKDIAGNNTAWFDFGSADDLDFEVDQTPPSTPAGISPNNEDMHVFDRGGGAVGFSWSAATDDTGLPVTYQVWVSTDPMFGDTLASATSASTSTEIFLRPSNFERYWRVRAVDVGGNTGTWSAGLSFRVNFRDLVDHGAGDAGCAGSVRTSAFGLAGAMLIVLLAARRR